MANYILNANGSLTKNKKKKKGNNYILQDDGEITLNSSDIAPVKKTTENTITNNKIDGDYSTYSRSDLQKEVSTLQKQLSSYGDDDGKISLSEFWDAFTGKTAEKNKKDEDYKALTEKYKTARSLLEDKTVEETKYKDGIVGHIEKSTDVILGNTETAKKGIESTISKVLGKTPTEEQISPTLGERQSAKALQESKGAEKVILDVTGSVARMIPQMMVGNPIGATAMGFANYGGGAYNQARQDGYSDEKATIYGATIGGMEMALTHALGSFGNIYGKTALGKASQGVIDKFIPKIIANKQVREVLSQFGSEGIEEFLQEYIDGIAKDTLLDDKGLLKSTWENVTDTDKLSDALYSAFVGGLTGSAMATPRAIDSYKFEKATGRDYETRLTKNEQSVLDSEVNKRTTEIQKEKALNEAIDKEVKEFESTFGEITEAEKKGITERIKNQLEAGEIDFSTSKLSKKELKTIEEQVRTDLEKGNIDIDTIEDTLLGEKTAQIKELQQKLDKTTNEQEKAQIQAEISELQSSKAEDMRAMLGQDAYLQKSYGEANKKKQKFFYEVTGYESEYKKSLAKDFEKVANDTTKSHELFETLSKIAEDKQTSYGVINNEQLKQLGYDVEGKDVNGLVRVNKDGTQKVLINVDSSKAINRIVGHETTHLLESTKEYAELQEMVKKYATTKGDYDTKLKEITKLYDGIDADIEAEVTAELVGDYLFTDEAFVNNLSVEKPSIFKKIYNEIKHLYKLATAGSKEARQLEKVKKAFDKAYKQNASNTIETDTKYSVSDNQGRTLTKEQQEYFKDSKVRDENGNLLTAYHGTPNGDFTVFKPGSYFSGGKEYASGYEWEGASSISYGKIKTNPKTFEVYLNITNPFTLSNETAKDIYINEYIKGGNSAYFDPYTDYTDTINNMDEIDWVEGEDLKEWLQENHPEFDGLFLDEGGDGGYGMVEYRWRGISFVPFNSNQIKSVDNTKPTTDEDIRYSLSVKSVDEQLYDKYSEKVDNGYNVVNEYKKKYKDYTESEEFKTAIKRIVHENITLDSDIYKNELEQIIEKANEIQRGLNFWQEQLDRDKAKLNEIAERLDAEEESNKIQLTPEEIVKKAEEHFGITNNFKETAYIDINGNQIDFSGKHEGGPSGVRTLDHRQINEIDTDMDSFINMGNIRILPEGGGINLAIEPNKSQYNKLYDYIDSVNGEIYIDIDKSDGTYDSAEYKAGTSSSKIISDLKTYFKTGSFPKQSEFAEFRYSLSKEGQDIAPVRSDVFGSDIKLQVEEAIAPLKEEIAEIKEVLDPEYESTVDYSGLTEEELAGFEQQSAEAFRNIPSEELDNMIAPMQEEPSQAEIEDFQDKISVDDKYAKLVSNNAQEVLGLDKKQAKGLEEVVKNNVNSTKEQIYEEISNKYSEFSIEHQLEDVKEIKRVLRQTKIKVGKQIKEDITDYAYLKQKNFGKIRFSNEGLQVDQVYEELSESYPDFFPRNITNPTDQLLKMIDVANEDTISIEKLILPEETIQEATDFIFDSIIEYKSAERIKSAEQLSRLPYDDSLIPAEETIEDIAPVVNASNKTLSKSNVPIGELSERAGEPIDLDKAKQLTIDGEEENLVKKTKKELRKALLGTEAQKEFITDVLDNAKNRSMALMNNTDTIRNTELVFGRDAGKVINELIFQKEIDNEADSIAWQNQERQEIKDLGIKARSKESAAVQKYGEKQYLNEKEEVVPYGDSELAKEFPDIATQNKIKNAAKVIRSKYDAYIDSSNEVLTKLGFDPIPKRKDYMRHFQELNDVFSRFGIPFNAKNMEEHTLPTDINGLTENWSPQKNYFASMQRRKGLKTNYDAITGIDGYIGGIANLIYHTEDIQRGRAFEELIRETYGEDKGFENLENLPDELKRARAEKIQDNHLSNYAAWVHEWTNNVAGKKSKIDRSVESLFGRKAFAVLDEVRKQVGANMIGFNLSSSLTNLIAPVQAASKTNKLAVLKGTADTIKNMFVKDDFMNKNKFLTARMGTDMLSQNAWQKIQNAGFVFMKGMDWFSSNQIVRSKYYEFRAKGMSEQEAHAEAGKFAARILGDRTKGANAQLYNSKLVGLVTQFQLEVNNQLYSQFYDTYHESKENAKGNALKTAAGMTFTLGQLFALTHLFGQTFEAIAGYNPTFDVVEMLKTAFGWDDEDDEEKTLGERLKSAADQLVDALPYVNILTGGGRIPVASGIPNLVGVATGGKDQYGNELTLEDELKKLLYLIPPAGGNQIKKTTQGLGMFDEDLPVKGSYTDSGNLRFPVEDTIQNRIQAGIFGQYANENASYYFDNELAPLKEKQIEEFKEMDIPYKDYREYRKELSEVNKTKADIDSDGKKISGTAAGKKAYKIMNGDYSKKEKERLLEGLSSETYKITTSDLNKLNNNEELYKYYFRLTTKGKSDFINAINNYGFDAETLYEANTTIKNIEDNYSKLNDNGSNLSKQKKQAIKDAISQYTINQAQYNYLYHKIYKK